MADKHNIRYAKLYASINCVHSINRLCVSFFRIFSSFCPSTSPFFSLQSLLHATRFGCVRACTRKATIHTASNVRKIGENDEKKKKNDTFYQPQMEHHLSSFQLFYFRAGGFIYCGVIEIAVGRGKNYIETAGASRKLSRLPNGRVKCCVDKSVQGSNIIFSLPVSRLEIEREIRTSRRN